MNDKDGENMAFTFMIVMNDAVCSIQEKNHIECFHPPPERHVLVFIAPFLLQLNPNLHQL